jgi:hypothetical protein
VSHFDISALLRQPSNVNYIGPRMQDMFDTNASNKKIGSIISTGDQVSKGKEFDALGIVNNNSVYADTRDIEFLRSRFFQDYRCDTNDIVTLFTYW